MAARMRRRQISNDQGSRLLSAQGMRPPAISQVVFTDPDTVRDVIHDVDRDGFDSLYPRDRGGPRAPSPCPSASRSRRSPSGCRRTSTSMRLLREEGPFKR